MQALSPILTQSSYPEAFAADVRRGLSMVQKQISCKYFYDQRGAALFERITTLPEYYPAACEMQIMQAYAGEMAAAIGPGAVLIEPGSGAAVKTRMLLDRLIEPVAYIPIDVSREQLFVTSRQMAAAFPRLKVWPVCTDFTRNMIVPEAARDLSPRLVYFPGSTIGNFAPAQAVRLLARLRNLAGPGGWLLIGVDLKKDPAILHAAYNDAAGVTAEFNRNLLHRINTELGGTFVPETFAHYAFYNCRQSRIEMHLVSRRRQAVSAADGRFIFENGEDIFTESSYKYDLSEFARLVARAGFTLRRFWLDDRRWFSVHLLEA